MGRVRNEEVDRTARIEWQLERSGPESIEMLNMWREWTSTVWLEESR